MKNHGFFWMMLVWSFFLQAQQDTTVLMYIGDRPVSVAEFERMYTKNLDLVQDPAQKDIDNYKELFINYRLQLADAKAKNYDKDRSFKSEFNRYRRELAKKYMNDPAILDSLVKEAYARMQKDVRVSHIMVRLPRRPSPSDTLKAYTKINRIYREVTEGLPFDKAAVLYSDDPSAVHNKGDIGWFTVFQTVYPFETAAYNTPVGKISKPFRTQYGYHIIRKEAERPAVHKIEVAQIAVMKKNNPQEAKQKIENIYRQLKQGEDTFENLARKFSEDPQTAKRGGKMAPFGIREKVPAFEEHAFALKNPGDISEPFETSRAWHIVKLLRKIPVPPFQDVKRELQARIAKSDRARIGREKLIRNLEKSLKVEMKGSLTPVYKLVDRKFFEGKWEFPARFRQIDDVLFVIDDEYPVTYRDFVEYLYRHQLRRPEAYKNKRKIVRQLFEDFKKEQLYKYYENNLEKFHPDFARTVQEYYDGLLLFNYKTKEIWEKALQDTLGLRKFYEQHKDRYRQKEKIRYAVIQTSDKKLAKKLYKALKKGTDTQTLMQLAGKKAVVRIRIDGKEIAMKKLKGAKKPILEKEENRYIIKGVLEKIPARTPGLEEIRGRVVSDYQQYLEEKLLEQLRKKYPVRINETAWQQLRAKYKG